MSGVQKSPMTLVAAATGQYFAYTYMRGMVVPAGAVNQSAIRTSFLSPW